MSNYAQMKLAVSLSCPVCLAPSCRILFVSNGYELRGCGRCGLRFLSPQPDDEALREIYGSDYFLGPQTADSEARVVQMKRATAASYLDILSQLCGPSVGNLLEIGCGRGEYLLEAQSRGFKVTGLEFSTAAARAANQLLGSERVLSGTLEAACFRDLSFDVVALIDAIEHVRDPRDFLGRIRRLLKPGGMLFIVTPSLDSLSARLMGKHWMEYKTEHLFYFGRKTIQFLLREIGFEEICTQPNFKILSLDYIHHHFQRFPVPVLTPLFSLLSRVVPKRIMLRQLKLPASSLIAMGRRVDASTAA